MEDQWKQETAITHSILMYNGFRYEQWEQLHKKTFGNECYCSRYELHNFALITQATVADIEEEINDHLKKIGLPAFSFKIPPADYVPNDETCDL